MPGLRTEITEIATALGTLAPGLAAGMVAKPDRLLHVSDDVWDRVVAAFHAGDHSDSFETAFANGVSLLNADDGLRGREPRLVEWKGNHRPPGDDVIPADLRIDHVFHVSCKYLSRITQNSGPRRLFDRLLVGEEPTRVDWFAAAALPQYQAFYDAVRAEFGGQLPALVTELGAGDRAFLREALQPRKLPAAVQPYWNEMSAAVASASAERWLANMPTLRSRLRMLWRLLRIGDATYFVLGAAGADSLRLRVASAWDWIEAWALRSFDVAARDAGQPEVGWHAVVRNRGTNTDVEVNGHVEIRWSHGRFQRLPEAKIYLDTPHTETAGYLPLT